MKTKALRSFMLTATLAIGLSGCNFYENEQLEHVFTPTAQRITFFYQASNELAFHYGQGGVSQVKQLLADSEYSDPEMKAFLTGYAVDLPGFGFALDEILNSSEDLCLIWIKGAPFSPTWFYVTPDQYDLCVKGQSSL
jgi:hypothetical protein